MGVNMEARDHQGNTALSLAAGNGHEGIVRFLLSEGANVDAESYTHTPRSGGTPLSQAVLGPHIGVIRILLDAGAKVETRRQCKTGMTTLNRAVHPPFFNEAVVQVVLEHGASIEIARTDRPYQGRTRLIMMASELLGLSIIRILLDKGANIEARDAREKTALHRAVEYYQVKNVQLLLEHGADPKSVDPARIGRPFSRAVQNIIDKCISLVREAESARNVESCAILGLDDAGIEGETESIDMGAQAQSTHRWPRDEHPDCGGPWCKHPRCAMKPSSKAFSKPSPMNKRLERARKRRYQEIVGKKK